MICCDVCWIVLGKLKNDNFPMDIHYVGTWEICGKCLQRYEDLIFKDVKSKEFKTN